MITIWRSSDPKSISFPGQEILYTVDSFPLLVFPVMCTGLPDLHDKTERDPLILMLQEAISRHSLVDLSRRKD